MRKIYLLYHEVRSDESRYSYSLDAGMFEKHIVLFDQLRKGKACELWPEITFDDGHISNFQTALPVLQARNIKGQFFITASWTGKKLDYMGWPELRSLHEAGHSIGAHGWTHTLLTQCSDQQLQLELKTSRLTLEDKLGIPITTMSLPGGRYNRRVLSACQDAGYNRVYTSVPMAETLPLGLTVGRLNIRREMQLSWIAELFQPNSSVLAGMGRQYKIKAAGKALLGDRLYGKLWTLVNRQNPAREDEVPETYGNTEPSDKQLSE